MSELASESKTPCAIRDQTLSRASEAIAVSPVVIGLDARRKADAWDAVRAVQKGDTARFAVLYQAYAPMLTRFFIARGFDMATAEDLTSETFVRALRSIGTVVDQGKDVRAWLVTIGKNLARDHVKAARTRREVAVADLPDEHRTVEGPETRVVARLEFAEAAAQLNGLSREQRQCLLHRRVFDRSVPETAARMGRSDVAVRALLHRAVLRLNATLAS